MISNIMVVGEKRRFLSCLLTLRVCLHSKYLAVSGLALCSAPSVPKPVFTITEKAPSRAFSWLKAPTSAFTFKTLLRHYAKQTLTPR